MRKFPFFRQLDSMDCGPTCLRIIAKYYGHNHDLDFFRKLVPPARDGVTLMDISIGAEKFGFKSLGAAVTTSQLVHEVPLPCILHWEQCHFVVLYKARRNWQRKLEFHISDPAKGLIKYNQKDFAKAWLSNIVDKDETGIILMLQPTSELGKLQEERKKRYSSLQIFHTYFKTYRKYFVQLAIAIVLLSLIQLIFPFLTQLTVDKGVRYKDVGIIYIIMAAQFTLVLGRMSVSILQRWILLHVSTRINVSLVSDFFMKLMKLPMAFFDTKLTGDIVQRIEDHDRLESFITTNSIEGVYSCLMLMLLGGVLWIYDLKIFLIFIIGSLFYMLWILFFLKKRRELDYQHFDAKSKSQSKMFQLIDGMQEIKLNNISLSKRWEWEDIQAALFKVNVSKTKVEQAQEIGSTVINETKNILIIIVSSFAVIRGDMTLGMMLSVQFILGQLTLPISNIIEFIRHLQEAQISLERINEIHSKNDENEIHINFTDFLSANGDIKLKNVSFGYEPGHTVLNNLNISIYAGKTTAIVGLSGSGKTTLLKLLLKYYSPTNGEIVFGNQNIESIETNCLREKFGVVMQDGYIFSDTIARNIALSNSYNIDFEKLKVACKVANIFEFIDELPLKFNTLIGPEGQNLSKGQTQRLLIARVVYKNPEYILLDEATNALDAINEKSINKNLEEFYKNKTVVIVAHRLSTVRNADQILVLNKGEIIEAGTHNDLVAYKGKYYNLVQNQLNL